MKFFSTHSFYLSALFIIWLTMLAIVNPLGNFPLNDDWMYARSVLYLLTQGSYKVTESYSPVLITQVAWGTMFCSFTGFSFTTLRISTLILGFIGILAFYFLTFNLNNNRKTLSFIGSLIILVNPLYFSLSNSFMTDVPFLSFVFISILFFVKSFEKNTLMYIVLGTVFSILATLIRQVGIVIPIAFGIVAFIRQGQNAGQRIKYLLPSLITILSLILALLWLNKHVHSGIMFFQSSSASPLFKDTLSKIYLRTGQVLIYCGLFLFPMLLTNAKDLFKNFSLPDKRGVLFLILLLLPSFIQVFNKFPCTNMINNGYIGPNTLRDSYVFHTKDLYNFPSSIKAAIYCIGFLGAILVIVTMWSALSGVFRNYKNKTLPLSITDKNVLFAFFILIGYCMLIFPATLFIDRYILPCIPIVWIISFSGKAEPKLLNKSSLLFISTYVIIVLFFSALCTHDWLAWNRSRWQGENYLTTGLKIPTNKIDAGYEDNGWLLGGEFSTHKDKTWWFVDDNQYMLTLSPVKGYSIIKQFPYTNYFPYEERSLYVLQKQ